MDVRRYPDWRPRLINYIGQARSMPHIEGSHDCALFAAGGVWAMTGTDYAAVYRGRYTTTLAGLRLLKRDGFEDHIALAAHHLNEVPPAFAQPGDLAAVPADDLPALGIVQGEWIYVLTLNGVGLAPLRLAERAFRV